MNKTNHKTSKEFDMSRLSRVDNNINMEYNTQLVS